MSDLVVGVCQHDLQWLKSQQPQLIIGALSAGIGLDYARFASQLGAWSINLSDQSINKKMIDDAHRRGLKVLIYTVNDYSQFKKLQQMGVDGVFTDYPLKMQQWLATK